MTIHHLLRILLARKWWIVGSVFVVVGVAVIALQVMSKRYIATASVVVNSRGDPISLAPTQSSTSSNALATQLEILKRPRVARRVVSDLGLDKDPSYKQAWTEGGSPGDFDAWLAQMAASGLSTANGSDSNVIDIQYTSSDPKYAARMANAFATAYLSTTLDLRTDPARQYVSFFDQRLAELRLRVEQAQGKLSSFEKESGIVNAGGKLDVENSRLAEFSSQLAAAKAQQADSSSRQRGTKGNAAVSPEIMQNPLIQSLKGQLAQQEVKVHEMSLRLGPNHPVFRQAQGELNEIRARLNAEIGAVTSSVNTAQNVSSDRVAQTQAAFDTQRQRVLSMQEQRDKAEVLQREVDNAQRAYELVMQRQTQTTLESQAQQTDVSLLDKASTPASSAFPNVRLTLMLSLLAGGLLGVVLALGREFFSPLIRSSEDLLTYTGLPVLAVVPSARLARIPRMALSGPRRVAGLLSN
jgi:chain length determinant protein EpsF